MILVVDCFQEDGFAATFDRVVAAQLERAGSPARFVRWDALAGVDPEAFSHLIISGSVASATGEQPWDRALAGLVRHGVERRRPVLGICYGHQFLAKVLAGPRHVRRAARAEFGYRELELAPNPLFAGLRAPLVAVSHYDEACDLPADFRVLGSTPDCAVHAFQYRDLPVWGVQFHPEYGAAECRQIWTEVFARDPRMIPAPPADPRRLDQNGLIFRNFAAAR